MATTPSTLANVSDISNILVKVVISSLVLEAACEIASLIGSGSIYKMEK